MRESAYEETIPSFNPRHLLQIIRAVSAGLGVIAITIGLIYVTRIFSAVFSALQGPETFQGLLDKWIPAVGGDELDIVTSGGATYHTARLVAIIVLGGGSVVLAWISMGLILTGAKIVSWTLSDREAIKRMLVYAFGPTRIQEQNRQGKDRGQIKPRLAGIAEPEE